MQSSRKKLFVALSAASLVTGLGVSQMTTANDSLRNERLALRAAQPLPANLDALKLDAAVTAKGSLSAVESAARSTAPRQRVIVRLKEKPVARAGDLSASARVAHRGKVRDSQDAFVRRAATLAPGSKVLARTQVVLNAVFLDMDVSQMAAIRSDSDVLSVNLVSDYKLDLPETVPYIGGTAVQNTGVDGAGVKVAVLDSGIDYTHAALGGEGTAQAYEDAWGTFVGDPRQTMRDGLFPTAKVVDGYDFVGEDWPNTPEAPDDDPIDLEGHGTHVADIIAGSLGVAPGADLYAVKVCSAVSSSCSGIALIQGMEFAVDPNGDGDPSDRVDVINMSLGSPYGQPFDDDLSTAVENATALGVLTVASAGNSGDKPYATGTPSATASALSVAQTEVPSAVQPFLTLNDVDYPAVFQPWSTAPVGVVSGPLQYADGAGGNLNGCAPFAPGSLTGLVVLVDRGGCNFTLKIKTIGDAGGVAGIIGLIAPGDPFSGGDGGDSPITIPGYMISQADSNAFKAQVGDEVIIDPSKGVPLVGSMVGSSSRGPQDETTTLLKPEIGAPGASVSAIAGSGTGTGPFGGTSGAAPMVAGSAALLLQSEPNLSPAETKARLMNTADTDITTDPAKGLAPITRIGGGEVRVDQAVSATTAAWDQDTLQGGLSFGFVDVERDQEVLVKTVVVKNYSYETAQYTVSSNFRFEDDEVSGAVTVVVPEGKIAVRARGTATFNVRLIIQGDLLNGNFMNSGSEGANPDALTINEFDGYITLDDGTDTIQMPWHVLPRKASSLRAQKRVRTSQGSATISLPNVGVGTAQNEAYNLIALSDDMPEGGVGEQAPKPDLRAVGVNTIPVEPGFCSAEESFLWTFAISTWERQEHLLPVTLIVYLDTNQDGVDDYAILNRDASGLGTITDGRQVSYALNLETGESVAFFFTEHSMNTTNTVHIVCAEQVGLTAADMMTTQVDVSVEAQDFYYGGPGDFIDGLTITPLGERYLGLTADVPGKGTGSMEILDFGAMPGNSAEPGILLFSNSDRGTGNRGGATQATETRIISVN